MAAPGIFCLEGEWSGKLTDRTSVEPQLRMLENLGTCARVIHRDVATREEFSYYANKWLQKQYASFKVGYLAFHGTESSIQLGRDSLSLPDIAEVLGKRAAGRTLYFGSCSTMAASDADLTDFVRTTDVKAILGYTKRVGWLETAAFDFILLPLLLQASYSKTIYSSLLRDHRRFVHGLGFRLVTKDFVSPRKIARSAVD